MMLQQRKVEVELPPYQMGLGFAMPSLVKNQIPRSSLFLFPVDSKEGILHKVEQNAIFSAWFIEAKLKNLYPNQNE